MNGARHRATSRLPIGWRRLRSPDRARRRRRGDRCSRAGLAADARVRGPVVHDWDGIGGLDDIRPVGLRNYEPCSRPTPRSGRPSSTTSCGWWRWSASRSRRARHCGRPRPRAARRPLLPDRVLPADAAVARARRPDLELQYSPDQGFLNGLLGRTAPGTEIDWLGDRALNRWAVLVPRRGATSATWCCCTSRGSGPSTHGCAKPPDRRRLRAPDPPHASCSPAMRPVTVVVLVDHGDRGAPRVRHRRTSSTAASTDSSCCPCS